MAYYRRRNYRSGYCRTSYASAYVQPDAPSESGKTDAWHHFLFETLLGGMNTVGTSQGIFRTARGGSWTDEAVGCRAAIRSKALPGQRSSNLGFRIALVPSK